MGLRTISLCTGGGGLELGVRLAGRVSGFSSRVVCYVEREAYAQAVLVSRIQEGNLDQAPIWSDLKTFDPSPWRGKVDLITGGYPCQPFSHAGKRLAEQDPRHLWPDIRKIIGSIKPSFCFFENVDGHLAKGYDTVKGDLEELGYTVTQDIFAAEEVLAPHRRNRLFILAYRKGARLANPDGSRRRTLAPEGVVREGRVQGRRLEGTGGPGDPSPLLRAIPGGSEELAHSQSERRIKSQVDRNAGTEQQSGRIGPTARGNQLFPPGPEEFDRWLDILETRGDLAPALPHLGARGFAKVLEAEPEVRGMVDGLASELDDAHEMRAERISLLGNGVVPQCAAFALCVLAMEGGLIE